MSRLIISSTAIRELAEKADQCELQQEDEIGATLRMLVEDRDNEKEARQKTEMCLRDKDKSMDILFDLLRENGVDFSHLIS